MGLPEGGLEGEGKFPAAQDGQGDGGVSPADEGLQPLLREGLALQQGEHHGGMVAVGQCLHHGGGKVLAPGEGQLGQLLALLHPDFHAGGGEPGHQEGGQVDGGVHVIPQPHLEFLHQPAVFQEGGPDEGDAVLGEFQLDGGGDGGVFCQRHPHFHLGVLGEMEGLLLGEFTASGCGQPGGEGLGGHHPMEAVGVVGQHLEHLWVLGILEGFQDSAGGVGHGGQEEGDPRLVQVLRQFPEEPHFHVGVLQIEADGGLGIGPDTL